MLSRPVTTASRAALHAPAVQLGSRGGLSTLAFAGFNSVVSSARLSTALLPRLTGVARMSSAPTTYVLSVTNLTEEVAEEVDHHMLVRDVKKLLAAQFASTRRTAPARLRLRVAMDPEDKVLSDTLSEYLTVAEALAEVTAADGHPWQPPAAHKWRLVLETLPRMPSEYVKLLRTEVINDEVKVIVQATIGDEDEFKTMAIAYGGVVCEDAMTNELPHIVANYDQAVELSKRPFSYLLLGRPTMGAPGMRYTGFIDSKALEEATTCAIAQDAAFKEAYGPLQVLNSGRGITIKDAVTKAEVIQLDGVVASTTSLLVNECKATFKWAHIEKSEDGKRINLLQRRCETVKKALANPGAYVCESMPDFLEKYSSFTEVIPVASGVVLCEWACVRTGTSYLKPVGDGTMSFKGIVCGSPAAGVSA